MSFDGIDITLKAAADANTWGYHFVAPDTTVDQCTLATGASGPAPAGILQDNPKSGGAGKVRVIGLSKIYADGSGTAINIRDFVTSGSDGQAVITAGSGAMGIALNAVPSGASVLIDMLLLPQTVLADNTP